MGEGGASLQDDVLRELTREPEFRLEADARVVAEKGAGIAEGVDGDDFILNLGVSFLVLRSRL
jgi:hypothetical protein